MSAVQLYFPVPSHIIISTFRLFYFLQGPACKLVSIPPAAIGGERCWSGFAHIWTSKRGRLQVGRVGMLAYFYYNWRVMQRQQAAQATEFDWEALSE